MRWSPAIRVCLLGLLVSGSAVRDSAAQDSQLDSAQPAPVSTARTLTTAEQVHRLTRDEAQRGYPARIRGVVTCSLPQFQALVIQDATRGIYVDHLSPDLGATPRVGDLLEIEGITHAGDFAPSIQIQRLTHRGQATLPQPIHPTWDQLSNGSLDTQCVEIGGVVTGVLSNQATLLTHAGKIKVTMVGAPEPTVAQYKDCLIRLQGCLFASWDPATHQVRIGEVRLFEPQVTVEEGAPSDLFNTPSKQARELLLFDSQASALRRVKVSGQILHKYQGVYYLVDGSTGLRFITQQPIELAVGDQVEAVGFPSLVGPSPMLQETIVRKTGSAALPAPKKLGLENLFVGEHDATLVQIEAELLRSSLTVGGGQILELQAGVRRFIARLGTEDSAVNLIPPGSRLALTGVFSGRGGNRAAGREIDSFELLLNSPQSIAVLSRPPWWNLRRVLWTLGAVSLVLLAVICWVLTLKRRVRVQTEIIRQKVQHETVLEERTRIARELHDTLEQALAGIGMQLDAASNMLVNSADRTDPLQTLNMARFMVRHSQEEARRSVWNLRTCALDSGDLPKALSQMKTHLKNGSPIEINFEIVGGVRPLPSRLENHLLRIGQEATTNAIKHAQCKKIHLRLDYDPQRVQLSVSDDGRGFDAKEATTSEAGHFGLLGMRERAEKIGGTLTIASRPGSGTKINITVPHLPERVVLTGPALS